jgi:hypothetical protein
LRNSGAASPIGALDILTSKKPSKIHKTVSLSKKVSKNLSILNDLDELKQTITTPRS